MTEQAKELLSVLMDGEASEIEVHRLLRMMGDDESIRRVWISYQETRRVIRRPSALNEPGIHLNADQHLALHSKISQAISDDVVHGATDSAALVDGTSSSALLPDRVAKSNSATGFGFRPAAAFAMAASLVVAVFVGTQIGPIGDQLENQAGGSVVAQSNSDSVFPASKSSIVPNTNIRSTNGLTNNTQLVSTNTRTETGIRNEPTTGNLELRELDAEGQKRLRSYLNEHEQMARMKSNTQFVTYPGASRQ